MTGCGSSTKNLKSADGVCKIIERGFIAGGRSAWPQVLDAFKVPEKIRVSQWAATHRILAPAESSEPGPWNNVRTPYLAAIMDCCGDPRIIEIVIMKAAQVGVSEAVRNALAYWIGQDPGPALFVMPDEKSGRKVFTKRIVPMIRGTAHLKTRLTGRPRDVTKHYVWLSNMSVNVGWAGSPESLATDPCRYVIFDETDKYPLFSGREADPISLGEDRVKTYRHRAKVLKISTPTTRQGYIWHEWESAPVQLRYHVSCPHCGKWQMISWSSIRMGARPKGMDEDKDWAREVVEMELAWLECEHCGERIHDREKPHLLERGVWARDAEGLSAEEIEGTCGYTGVFWPQGKVPRKVAFHVPAVLSPWETFPELMARFILARGIPEKMMDFRNSTLAEPFEQEGVTVRKNEFSVKVKADHPPRILPAWTGVVIATADTQKDHFWLVVRAWGPGFHSRLLDYGKVTSFEELHSRALETVFPGEDEDLPKLSSRILLIDAGGGEVEGEDSSRTHQVYQFARRDQARVLPLRGFSVLTGRRSPQPFYVTRNLYTPPGQRRPIEVQYLRIDVNFYKDVLARRIKGTSDAPDAWELHREVGDDYCLQMASEHKILVRRGSNQIFTWEKISMGAANHLWDCEVYQSAGADYMSVGTMLTAARPVVKRRLSEIQGRRL